MAVFTVDWEEYFNAVSSRETWGYPYWIFNSTIFLLCILKRYEVKAIWYILGWLANERPDLVKMISSDNHTIGSHGYWHGHNESDLRPLFRSPYWDTTPMPWPPSGGFFFRIMPLWYLKWAIKKSGVFWIHPHDVMDYHPPLKNPLLNLKRHWGLKGARAKLDRLLSEVKWDEPSKD